MNEDKPLQDQLAKTKNSIQGYRSLPEYLLDGLGAILTFWRRPPEMRKPILPADASKAEEFSLLPYWFSGLIIAALTFLIGWLTSISLDQPFTIRDIRISLWAVVTGAMALIANKTNIRAFLKTFNDSILEKILLPDDLRNLENWLKQSFDIFLPLTTGLVLGPGLAWILIRNLETGSLPALNPGTIVVVALSCIQSVWVAFYLYPFYVVLPARLVRYRFDIYKLDPSSSEVLGQLSRLMTFIMYITLAYIVFLTIGLNLIGVLNRNTSILFSVTIWMPTIVLYATGQFHISSVITQAKWQILNEIQVKIESLYSDALKTNNALIKKEMMETIEKMTDSHDRIRTTPNSTLNIRSALNFLNSLMLPILAFIAANLSEVVKFIKDQIAK